MLRRRNIMMTTIIATAFIIFMLFYHVADRGAFTTVLYTINHPAAAANE